MIDLTPIFQAIICLLAAIVTYKVIPWIKAKTTNAQQEKLAVAYKIAVLAAEQLYGAGHGTDKYKEAKTIIERSGFTFDENLLEATVYEQLTQFKEADDVVVQTD